MFTSNLKKIEKAISNIYLDEYDKKIFDLELDCEVKEKDNAFVIVISNYKLEDKEISAIKKIIEEKIAALKLKKKSVIVIEKSKSTQNERSFKKLIAISSGKGGVGKSTICVNLAKIAADQGLKVGILDADIYGPSIHYLLDLENFKPEVRAGKMLAAEKYGIKFMSMGFLIPADSALIWRGAMVSKTLNNLLNGTDWGDLDVLFVDMPPGTGDIYLSLSKITKIDLAILVATAQKIALIDVQRSIDLLNKLEIKIAGLIANMSHKLENDKKQYSFGDSLTGFAEKNKIKLLAEMPYSEEVIKLQNKQEFIDKDSNAEFYEIYMQILKQLENL